MSRELDAKVAELVMGHKVLGRANCCYSQDGTGWYVECAAKPGEDPDDLHPVYAHPQWDGKDGLDDTDWPVVFGCPVSWLVVVPHYTIDVSADYTVLEQVRTWTRQQVFRFGCALDEVWAHRAAGDDADRYVPENAAQYQPGDYSKAALAALGAT